MLIHLVPVLCKLCMTGLLGLVHLAWSPNVGHLQVLGKTPEFYTTAKWKNTVGYHQDAGYPESGISSPETSGLFQVERFVDGRQRGNPLPRRPQMMHVTEGPWSQAEEGEIVQHFHIDENR